MTASDDRHLRPLVKAALLIDDIHEFFRAVRQEHADDGANDKARCDKHQGDAEHEKDDPDNRRDHIIVAALPEVDGAKNRLFNNIEIFIVEHKSQAEAHQHDAAPEQEHPALEVHPRIKPF